MVEEYRKQAYKIIDCQVYTRHLESLGAEEISREEFQRILQRDI
jgi:leucyl/phenylalanyl-tRNA--protein transferase